MPYRRKQNYKGRHRRFTSEAELESQRKQEENFRSKKSESSTEEEEESDDDENKLEICNPNRVVQKSKKISQLTDIAPVTLSRKDKEEIEKQESTRQYQQLHAQGKTDEAQADLARLAIVRKQREDAARKREEEKKSKEIRLQAAKEASLNAIKKPGNHRNKK